MGFSTQCSQPWQTVTHTSAYLLNKHPSVWGASADDFDPDRWLGPLSAGLEKYMTSFYRGTRQCLGMQYVLFHLRV